MANSGSAKGAFRKVLLKLGSTHAKVVVDALQKDVREFAERAVLGVAVPPAQPRKLVHALLEVATTSSNPDIQRKARASAAALPALFSPLVAAGIVARASMGSGTRSSGALLLAACALVDSQCLATQSPGNKGRARIVDAGASSRVAKNSPDNAKLPEWVADVVSAQAQLLDSVRAEGGGSHKSRGPRILESCERAISKAVMSSASCCVVQPPVIATLAIPHH